MLSMSDRITSGVSVHQGRWSEWLECSSLPSASTRSRASLAQRRICIGNLPRETRIAFVLCGKGSQVDNQEVELAW